MSSSSSSSLSLTSVNVLEQKIKKELRFYNTFLLAGNREHERNAWDLLVDVTNDFGRNEASNNNLNENNNDGNDIATSTSWILERKELANLTWKQYAGHVILT